MSEQVQGPGVIELLRHGETTAGKCFLGSTDAELSELGWQQMQAVELSDQYDLIISSPLSRCRSFSKQFAEKIEKPLQVVNEFREIDYGDWEAKTSDELWHIDENALADFWQDPVKNTPPGGESIKKFQKRILKRYNTLSNELADKRVLLVTHAGVIKIILCDLLGIDLNSMNKLAIDHACVSQVLVWQNKPQSIQQIKYINRAVLKY